MVKSKKGKYAISKNINRDLIFLLTLTKGTFLFNFDKYTSYFLLLLIEVEYNKLQSFFASLLKQRTIA